MRDPRELPALLERLEATHAKVRRLPPRRALDWILWENTAYLVPDARREEAYRALREATGLTAADILALPREALRELAALGGMSPDRRVEKLLAIATTVQDEFGGDLEPALALQLSMARRALKRFPGIGDPGADKVLLFTGTHALAALDSNGLRALVRLGFTEEAKSYSTTYRAATRALDPFLERGCAWLVRAHGQRRCKNSAPLCDDCPLADTCPSSE